MNARGAIFGILAAALFGLSTPLAKVLLPDFGPLVLASLLYLGGGVGLTLYRFGSRAVRRAPATKEAPLGASDLPALIALVLLGGVGGPLLMLWGLGRLSGMTASLLLNLEGPLTVAVSVVFFREHLGMRGLIATACVFSGAAVLSLGSGRWGGEPVGALAIAGACACWAFDNNLSQRLSLKDPVQLVQVKTLGAGGAMLLTALAAGDRPLEVRAVVYALLLGSLSYGASILLDTYALRFVGAGREAAYFATAPFLGAAASIPILGEHPTLLHALTAVLMVSGVMLLLRESHSHFHTHGPLEHEHLHFHDAHHQHAHPKGVDPGEPHSHPHVHDRFSHDHPHAPDAHHRHPHH